jgi:3-hydroxybutyryl-CoA dehydrogenase
MKIQNIAVIGAGPMGSWLAALFSGAGFDTVLEDILPSNLRRAQNSLIGDSVASGGALPANLRFASSIEDAVRAADLIVDSVPDELESKQEIFSLLDRMAPPRAVFATPTRAVSIADLASCTYRGDRCLGLQFSSGLGGDFPPAGPLEDCPLVLVSTSVTSPEVLQAVLELWSGLGFRVESRLDPMEASVAAGTLF